MNYKLTVFFLGAVLLSTASGVAQTADQWFNQTAKEYIYSNTEVASNMVTRALTQYPDDGKLQKLKELIDQQNEQQQQNQDQQNQDNQQDQQQNQDQQQQDQNQDQQDQNQQNQDNRQEPESDEQNQPQQPEDQQQQQAPPQEAGQMSPEEARQLLDAMKQNEQDQRSDLRPYLGAPIRVDKDW